MAHEYLNRSTRATPAELRGMFGANLRLLANQYPSVAALCRELDINRTQFNRYLAGDSFPRPDVLHRICLFFNVDARILLEPVGNIEETGKGFLFHPVVDVSFGAQAAHVEEEAMPSGFFAFSRRSFTDDTKFIRGLIYLFRQGDYTFLRGYEARQATMDLGLGLNSASREFRGFAMKQEDGIAILISRRGANTGTFNFLTRAPSFQNNFYEGYVVRTSRENTMSTRVTRLVFEHLGVERHKVMQAARTSGFCRLDDLQPFHRRLLRPAEPFR